MKDLFKKAGEFASRAGTAIENAAEDLSNVLTTSPETKLETKIAALLKTNFNEVDKYQTSKLIQEIIDLSIKIQTTDGSDRAIRNTHVAGKISGSAKEQGKQLSLKPKASTKNTLNGLKVMHRKFMMFLQNMLKKTQMVSYQKRISKISNQIVWCGTSYL